MAFLGTLDPKGSGNINLEKEEGRGGEGDMPRRGEERGGQGGRVKVQVRYSRRQAPLSNTCTGQLGANPMGCNHPLLWSNLNSCADKKLPRS